MDWIQVFTIIGVIGGLTFWMDSRNREDMKGLDARHREDQKENDKHWREMFIHFNQRLDESKKG